MKATLDEMILYTARQTKRTEDVFKTAGVYTEDALVIVDKFIDGFNYAKNKIFRERFQPMYVETVTIDSDDEIDLSTLTKPLFKVKEIYMNGCKTFDWKDTGGFRIKFPTGSAGTDVAITYVYMIPDFKNNPTQTDLEVQLDFPEAIVDYRILCFYATYEYHLIKGSDRDLDKTGFFLAKWNDGFLHIPKSVKGVKMVQDRAGY